MGVEVVKVTTDAQEHVCHQHAMRIASCWFLGSAVILCIMLCHLTARMMLSACACSAAWSTWEARKAVQRSVLEGQARAKEAAFRAAMQVRSGQQAATAGCVECATHAM
jgi:hypothetical protein